MEKLASSDLWAEVERLARNSERIRCAVGYVTSEAKIQFRNGDLLIVDASDGAITCGETSASLLGMTHDAGAELYSYPGLHAKVFLLDSTVVIGSANISASSVDDLLEAAWITDRRQAVSSVAAFLDTLKRRATRIDKKFLQRIKRIKVIRTGGRGHGKRPQQRIILDNLCMWLSAVRELSEDAFPAERSEEKQGLKAARRQVARDTSDPTWIRFTGGSSFRKQGKLGDSAIQVWECSDGSVEVYPSAPIVHRQDGSKWTRFWIDEDAMKQGRPLTWQEFTSLAARAGLPKNISKG